MLAFLIAVCSLIISYRSYLIILDLTSTITSLTLTLENQQNKNNDLLTTILESIDLLHSSSEPIDHQLGTVLGPAKHAESDGCTSRSTSPTIRELPLPLPVDSQSHLLGLEPISRPIPTRSPPPVPSSSRLINNTTLPPPDADNIALRTRFYSRFCDPSCSLPFYFDVDYPSAKRGNIIALTALKHACTCTLSICVPSDCDTDSRSHLAHLLRELIPPQPLYYGWGIANDIRVLPWPSHMHFHDLQQLAVTGPNTSSSAVHVQISILWPAAYARFPDALTTCLFLTGWRDHSNFNSLPTISPPINAHFQARGSPAFTTIALPPIPNRPSLTYPGSFFL
jgi:hypothetical protein